MGFGNRHLNLLSLCVRQKPIDIGIGTMAAGEIPGAHRRARLASRKTRHEPGKSGCERLAGVRREDLAFRFIVRNAAAREGSS